MESHLIRKFCHNLDTKLLDKLTQTTQNLLIQGSYICLAQKYGNQQAAIVILEHFGEIEEVAGTIIYKGSFDLEGYEALKRMGVVTIPVIPKNEISDIRERFLDTLRNFPEYKRSPDNPDLDSEGNPLVYVLGGFAALGNPASFHNSLVRELRQRCYETILPLFQQMIKNYANKNLRDNTKFEMLIDRMLYRLISQKPVPESWHRDVMPKKKLFNIMMKYTVGG